MAPAALEEFCMEVLKGCAKKEKLQGVSIEKL